MSEDPADEFGADDELVDLTRQRSESIEITLQGGEWWYYAAAIEAFWPIVRPEGRASVHLMVSATNTSPRPHGCLISAIEGSVSIRGAENKTIIIVRTDPTYRAAWENVQTKLKQMARSARDFRRESIGPTVDSIIAAFDRAKAAGESVTLRQLAEDAGMSYAYLRKRRSEKRSSNK
jgi:hypothetical protein